MVGYRAKVHSSVDANLLYDGVLNTLASVCTTGAQAVEWCEAKGLLFVHGGKAFAGLLDRSAGQCFVGP
jgi:hypothetical protein